MDKEVVRAPSSRLKNFLKGSYGLVQTFSVFLLLFVTMSIFLPSFMTALNLMNIVRQLAVNLIVAAGMTIIILTGEFDISVGSVVCLSAVVVARLINVWGIIPATLFGLAVGLLFGWLHGIIVTKGRIPSFIATLGTSMIARSLAFVVSDGKVISDIPESFKVVGQQKLFGVPYTLFFVIAVYAAGYIMLTHTPFGKKIYAVGANRKAAMLSGINADRVKIIAFCMVGFLAALGGVLILSRMGAIQPYTARGLEFDVIAAVVIGGTSLSGGEGSILQTIIGIFIIGIIRNALNLSQINIFWQDFATGSIIIVAVLLDAFRKRMSERME